MSTQHEHDIDRLLTSALEQAPTVAVPSDFALKVMTQIAQEQRRPALHGARALAPRYGRFAAYTALCVTAVSLLILSLCIRPTGSWYVSQLVLTAQLACMAIWIGVAFWRSQ